MCGWVCLLFIRDEKEMIVCKCVGCRHHNGQNTCGLDSITISAHGKCWSSHVTREKNAALKLNVSRSEFEQLKAKVLALERKD